jgi:uncharacterized protein (DUF885 family)
VRSARVVMDVGLNYLGWSRKTAEAYWHKHIPNQDDIMTREINRMIRWPAQVVTYKVGEQSILKMRHKQEAKMGSEFDLKRFHTQILKHGSIPLDVLEKILE